MSLKNILFRIKELDRKRTYKLLIKLLEACSKKTTQL